MASHETGDGDEHQSRDDQDDLQDVGLDDGQLSAQRRIERQRQADGQSGVRVGDVDDSRRDFRRADDLRGDDAKPRDGDDAARQLLHAVAVEASKQGGQVVAFEFRKWLHEKEQDGQAERAAQHEPRSGPAFCVGEINASENGGTAENGRQQGACDLDGTGLAACDVIVRRRFDLADAQAADDDGRYKIKVQKDNVHE